MQLSFTDLDPRSTSGLSIRRTAPGGALDALAAAIDELRGPDRLAPVTVVVPSNVAGVMARRALGRRGGVLGVDMVTLGRVAELVAGPRLAAEGRRPVSTPVLELTVRRVLAEAPGMFAPVAEHPATVTALRELHQALRLADPQRVDELAGTRRGREVVRVSRAVARMLARSWYDEADLFAVAADGVGGVGGLRRTVLHLPTRLDHAPRRLVGALAAHGRVVVTSVTTGDATADRAAEELLTSLGATDERRPDAVDDRATTVTSPTPHAPQLVVSTTDADDEVRVAVRTVVDAARGALTGAPVPFERIAVLWPSRRPYGRLVEHHLAADDLPWNGRGGTDLTERIAPRLLLDLLDLDRRGLGRSALFDLLADVPARVDGRLRPTAEWERVARAAGVHDESDWAPRLGALTSHPRWGEPAASLLDFVTGLRTALGDPRATRSWVEWSEWCDDRLDDWLGRRVISRLPDPEYRAWEALVGALDRLRGLDHVAEPVDRRAFHAVLRAELEDLAVRDGRIGSGVTVGSLATAAGLDVDVAVVVGGADGILPPAPDTDPLLGDAERVLAGLPGAEQRALDLHHQLVALFGAAHVVVTVPRGDLRSNTAFTPSRWIRHLLPPTDGGPEQAPAADTGAATDPVEFVEVASAAAGLRATRFAPSPRERRLRDHQRHVARHGPLTAEAVDPTDTVLVRALEVQAARASHTITEFDGDLTAVDVPRLGAEPVSPTRLETWSACPHAYFVHYLLGVRPIDDGGDELTISPLDVGSLQHDVLDAFHRRVIGGELPQPGPAGWGDVHVQALHDEFDRATSAVERRGRTGRPATWAGRRRRLWRELLTWLHHDGGLAAERRSSVVASELRFPDPDRPERATVGIPLSDGRTIPLQGSIDRVDLTDRGALVVTDHKTGGVTSYRGLGAADPTVGGTRLQLPTYALAAAALVAERPVEQLAIRSEYSFFGKGRYQRIGYDLDPAVWVEVRAQLDRIVAGIEAGWFPQLPERPGFRVFVSCEYCEPDHLGTLEAWERWQRKRHDERVTAWFGTQEPTR